MALLLKKLVEGYQHYVFDDVDPRTKSWPLIRSPIPIAFILCLYLLFVFEIGPAFMRNRKPYELKKCIIAHNIFQVLACSYSIYKGFPRFISLDWRCSEINYNEDLLIPKLAYVYFVLKLLDLLDTVFFTLRKRTRQITYLHVYHHAIMVFISWLGVKYYASGHSIYMPYINNTVHAIMYTYYLLSIYDEEYKKNIWWKKYITQIQLIQFAAVLILYTQPLLRPSCSYPKKLLILVVPQNLMMFLLFGDFYYKNYIKKATV